jgi:putative component of membrane protein insertase Oxa1/YidC/SpoIIIJ protein YidD
MELRISKCNPLRGSSYIPLPKVLANKKAIINVQNEDDEC